MLANAIVLLGSLEGTPRPPREAKAFADHALVRHREIAKHGGEQDKGSRRIGTAERHRRYRCRSRASHSASGGPQADITKPRPTYSSKVSGGCI